MVDIKIDPKFASLIPPLTEEERMQLEANLIGEGCRDPLIVWGDILIDGHNRLEICKKHEIPYKVTERNFDDRDEALQYIILNQLGRRNLSLGNRSLLSLKVEHYFRAMARKNKQKAGGAVPQKSAKPVDTREEIAKIARVSHDTISKTKKIVELGTPEQVARIKEGGKGNSINAVYKEVNGIHSPNPEDKDAANEEDLAKSKKHIADLKNPNSDRSLTTGVFLQEYAAFAKQVVSSIESYDKEPYLDIYPKLSYEEYETISRLNTVMSNAIKTRITKVNSVKEAAKNVDTADESQLTFEMPQ